MELSYELLPAPVILSPMDEATGIPINGLTVMCEQVAGAESICLEIEDEEEAVALEVDLPGNATSFDVPFNRPEPMVQYVLDIKADGANGNQTVTDLRFTTGP